MTAIKQEDLIQSVTDAFQYISYYHPDCRSSTNTRRI